MATQARVAHFTRTGNLRTPSSAARSVASSAEGCPCIIARKAATRARASSRVFPRSSSVIIEAEAWLMEQPRPSKRTSRMRPSATRTVRASSSPHRGLAPSTTMSAGSSRPRLRGWL